jgi:elongation factor P--(R)-beta-lysine ligase
VTDTFKHKYRNLKKRSLILNLIRDFFIQKGYLEVETPIRCPLVIPEAQIDPVASDGWYLQASPELCMKRLVSSSFRKIFQICKCFRNNERGNYHLPELTMLEWYTVGDTYFDLMNQCEALIKFIALNLSLNSKFEYKNKTVNLDIPWEKLTVNEVFEKLAIKGLDQALKEDSFDETMSFEIEPHLGNVCPAFIYDYPSSLASLSKLKDEDITVSQRFEFYIAGIELANGFTELTDPAEQRARFEKENQIRKKDNLPLIPIPERFLHDLSKMPDTAGIALGIDRLVMLFCNADSIDDVVAFTPEDL